MAISNSIVDYLNSAGQDSSYKARKRLAQQQGISNYTGSARQNTSLLNSLRNAAASSSDPVQVRTCWRASETHQRRLLI